MNDDPELAALSSVCSALNDLDDDSRCRVVDYAIQKFNINVSGRTPTTQFHTPAPPVNQVAPTIPDETHTGDPDGFDEQSEETDGVSPIAIKWMKRNGLTIQQLGDLYSLGIDEIDLVAKTIPGSSKNQRTRSVVLLKGIAAYLSSGVARVTAEQIKEACLHYDAYDPPNHSKYLKKMASEVSGTKGSGYTLSPRGITSATELLNEMIKAQE